MIHLAGALRYLMPMDGVTAVFLLAIYRQFSTFKTPWLPIQRGLFISNHQKSTAIFFGGSGGVLRVLSYILKQMWCMSVCASVCRGPETHITFKTVPPNSRVQKLFRTSITHFYFFTYQVPSPESRLIQVPSPNTQASNYLLGCLRSEPNGKKKPGTQVCGTAGVSIKPGW
jgi:hypothetical protein